MSNNIKIVVAVLVGAVVGLGVSAVIPRESALGGVYSQVSNTFRDGIRVGTNDQFVVSSTGSITTTGSISTGAITSSGAITSTAVMGVGTSSPTSNGDVVVDGTGTTTIVLQSSTAAKGSCLQLENDAGVQTKAYIHGTSWVIAAGTCK